MPTLAELREEHDMSLVQLARKTGISIRHLKDMEQGERALSKLYRFRIAKVYGIALDEIDVLKGETSSVCPICGQRTKPKGLVTHVRLSHPDQYDQWRAGEVV